MNAAGKGKRYRPSPSIKFLARQKVLTKLIVLEIEVEDTRRVCLEQSQ